MSPHVGQRYLDGSVEHTSQESGIFTHTRALQRGAHPSPLGCDALDSVRANAWVWSALRKVEADADRK